MIRAIISLTLLLSFINSWAQNAVTWNNPVMLNNPILKFTKVEFTDTATIVSMHVTTRSVGGFGIPSSAKLIADGKDYAVKACSVAPIDSGVPLPESAELDCTVSFTPLPSTTKSFAFSIQGQVILENVHDRVVSRDGIKDSYWRDDKTGDWILGITEKNIIYDCKIWDISSMSEKKGIYTITATNNSEQISVTVGKEKNEQRSITIGKQKYVCSIINSVCLPPYPQKDTRVDFADNNYRKGDSVTIVGWIKDVPEKFKKRYNEFSLRYVSVFKDEDIVLSAKVDTLGRFTLRMPVDNSTVCYNINSIVDNVFVLEPNETYFMLADVNNGQTLFMGKESRILNEIANVVDENGWGCLYPKTISHIDVKDFDAMTFLAKNDSISKAALNKVEEIFTEHPTLSARFKTFMHNAILGRIARALMQGRFNMPNYIASDEYTKVVTEEYLKKMHRPYTTLERFCSLLRDYYGSIENKLRQSGIRPIKSIMYSADKDGIIKLTDKDKEAIDKYVVEIEALVKKLDNTTDTVESRKLTEEFNNSDFVKRINSFFEKKEFAEYFEKKNENGTILLTLEKIKSLGLGQDVQDFYLSNKLCWYIDWQRKALSQEMLEICENNIQLQLAKDCVQTLNDKYEAIGKRVILSDNLKSNDIVKDMSEGEQIFKKLVEPYKGKIILIDVWGTWCSPCKAALSHSQEEYERLKPYDMVFMYLANSSPEDSWKNVIKEYNVTGDNVVHFNLPKDQQRAVENYIRINGYPTYKLVDQDGNLLDVNADPRDLNGLEGLIKRMTGKE